MATLLHLTGRAVTDANGAPYPAAVAHFYLPGTTTAVDTYTTAGLSVANANPVVSDASTGIFPAIYTAGKRYKVVIKDSSGNTLQTWEVYDDAKHRVASAAAPSPTFPGLEWVDTDDNTLYERNLADDAWNNRGDADAAINAASVTETLTGTSTAKAVTPDAASALWQRGTDIASASTMSLPSTGGKHYNVTGTTTITAISTAQGGREITFKFASALTLTHNGTSLILPGAANITTVAGDVATFVNEAAADASGTNWRCTKYHRNSGSPVNVTDQLGSQAEAETGTSAVKTLSIANLKYSDTAVKAWMAWDGTGTPTATDVYNFATGSSGITDGGAGLYTLTFTTAMSTAAGYAAAGICNQVSAGNTTANYMQANGASASNVLAASFQATTGNANTGAPTDEQYNGIMFAGDF